MPLPPRRLAIIIKQSDPVLYILDPDKKAVPASSEQWSFETAKRIVADSILESGERIATIFLGVDSPSEGPPQLFESIVIGGKQDGNMWRYPTWEEAEAGHQRLIQELSRK
jgi:hypothetical protein